MQEHMPPTVAAMGRRAFRLVRRNDGGFWFLSDFCPRANSLHYVSLTRMRSAAPAASRETGLSLPVVHTLMRSCRAPGGGALIARWRKQHKKHHKISS